LSHHESLVTKSCLQNFRLPYWRKTNMAESREREIKHYVNIGCYDLDARP
jgi:hypothetical protein